MNIQLNEISKRYTRHWVLKKIDYSFESGKSYGVKGSNGSGKSTLMQILAGQLSATLGEVVYSNRKGEKLDRTDVFSKFTFSAPYISPLNNLSLDETLAFHCTFRRLKGNLSNQDFIDLLRYPFEKSQLVKYYSSGMLQRLSLALSILTESDVILLDEPGSYLDDKGKSWYHNLLQTYKKDSTLIISSNDLDDLAECNDFLEL